jgi:hypothetical protein
VGAGSATISGIFAPAHPTASLRSAVDLPFQGRYGVAFAEPFAKCDSPAFQGEVCRGGCSMRQGHFTVILFANCEPRVTPGLR